MVERMNNEKSSSLFGEISYYLLLMWSMSTYAVLTITFSVKIGVPYVFYIILNGLLSVLSMILLTFIIIRGRMGNKKINFAKMVHYG